ncbi:aldo/keto reductase [Thiohalobacter thiocyanaticus]|uniref:Protein tas n=1 Tax=Thiohalobacter thiocyanaticus TaxID=585455 RepID=A0A1Z4VNE6_9GAMM|nr:NADP(H)-dependent aldo-keto reductase [Thiohalobacter thiocyanaticus]BAZ92952.1 aldo/keto reductase [Thiohalobacter thiocyanaticus]
MHYRKLGHTDIDVSLICLGTMTFGEQNSERDAHEQLDRAVAAGVNFIDTAELYPVPPRGETQGRTEAYIGSWLARRGKRDDLVIASKVAGPTDWCPHIRGGSSHPDAANIEIALNDSLRRLQTDYIDLYQVHWPDRSANFFGKLGYEYDASPSLPIEDTLEALACQVEAGKIRHIGISNETPWGTMRYLQLAEARGWPRIVSIQNPYSLLNRSFEIGLAEISQREDVGLLAYSPLGFGVLSGKYLDGARPEGARLSLFERFSRYSNPQGERATAAYVALARDHGLDPAQMALAYVNSRPFVTANIIGATRMEQLESNLGSADLTLSEEVLEGIEAIHQAHPNPCP